MSLIEATHQLGQLLMRKGRFKYAEKLLIAEHNMRIGKF